MATKRSGGRRYGRAAGKSVESAMKRRNKGTLKRGKAGHGGRVKSREQAIAIGLSEAREKGAKVPRKRSSAKKSSARKSSARKSSSAKRSSTKRSSTKRSSTKRSAAKKSSGRKTSARKSSAKRGGSRSKRSSSRS